MSRSKWRLAAVGAAISALVIGLAVPALANDPPGTANDPRLIKFTSPEDDNGDLTAKINYVRVVGGDAPGSAADEAIRMETLATGSSHAGAKIRGEVGIVGQTLSNVNRIGFKTKGYSGAGAPRLSVWISSGKWVYLSAFYCKHDIGGGWSKTGFNTPIDGGQPACEIYTSKGDHYVADETGTAWQHLRQAEGGDTVVKWVTLVQDEGPATAYVDDVRLGGLVFAGPNVNSHNH